MTQFYGSIVNKGKVQKSNYQILNARLATIEGQLRSLEDMTADKMPLDMLRKVNGLDRTIDMLKGALIAYGHEVMASKFNTDWSPISPLRKLLDILKKNEFASESMELYIPQKARMEKELNNFPGRYGLCTVASLASHAAGDKNEREL